MPSSQIQHHVAHPPKFSQQHTVLDPGAQFYMECAQLNIVGGSGAKTPSTVSFPGAYSVCSPLCVLNIVRWLTWSQQGSDPGVKISIYYPPVTNYKVPGPSVFTC